MDYLGGGGGQRVCSPPPFQNYWGRPPLPTPTYIGMHSVCRIQQGNGDKAEKSARNFLLFSGIVAEFLH